MLCKKLLPMICFISLQIYTFNYNLDWQSFFQYIDIIETKFKDASHITIVRNNKTGELFLIKQKKFKLFSETFAIKETLASYIATSTSIPSQKVWIIPKNTVNNLHYKNQIATLHTFLPGETLLINNIYQDLDIRQRYSKDMDPKKMGITRNVIHQMSRHPDLPKIAALDTAVGNVDRSLHNILYDKKTDRFWSIDMDNSFYINLCEIAIQQIKSITRDRTITFSLKEIQALTIYRDTLIEFIRSNHPKQIVDLLFSITKYTGICKRIFNKEQKLHGDSFILYLIYGYKKNIIQSYRSAKELVFFLNKLLQNHVVDHSPDE